MESHRDFAAAQDIKAHLLADTDGKICRTLGVLPDPAGNAKRTTFIVDKQGIVRYVFESVQVAGHVDEVLAQVRAMNS